MVPSLGSFLRNVDSLIAMTVRLGVRPVFLTQPGLFCDTPYWRTIQARTDFIRGRTRKISAATEWRLLNRFNQGLMEHCLLRGAAAFDLAAAIPHDSAYFYDAYHFNEPRARLVAEKVDGFLRTLIRVDGGREVKP